MAFRRALVWFSAFCVILMALSSPSSVHSARFYGGSPGHASTDTTTMGIDKNKEASASVQLEDSARLVPTGPDPLHHNSNPTRP